MISIDELGFELSRQTVAIAAGDFILDVDKLIADTIVLLNKKGYKTMSSCQGHPGTGCNSYIEFRAKYDLPMPRGYKLEREPFFIRKQFNCLHDNVEVQKVMIRENAAELHRWAMALPDIARQ